MTNRKLLYFDSSYGYPTEISSIDSATAPSFVATGLNGVGFDAGGNFIQGVLDPTSPQQAATKHYVDSIAQGISAVPSVRALSNSNVNLSGTQTIDGVALAAGDRVLLTAQTNGIQNGVWIVSAGSWTRPTATDDYTSGSNATGRFVFIGSEGTVFANEGWLCVTSGSAVVDQTATKWTQFTAMGEIVAGNGLITSSASGNTVSVNLAATNPGLTFVSGALSALINATGGLQSTSTGLATLLNSSANTIASDASGLRTLGVPQGFTLGGVSTASTVTAGSLATLTGGTSSYADALHQHKNVLSAQTCAQTHTTGVALAAGDPVQWSSTADTLARCDASALATSQVIGIAAAAASANSQVVIVKRGLISSVLQGATPGSVYYLNSSGGLTTTLPTSGSIVRIGTAANATSLDVYPQYVGQRSQS